ncbi:hypothetical protein Tcan_12627 [Toxocara canis]|uniref:Saposin B-type domain-containing protein n=1 Tax=Toxocara canis TaxID=6265 RepID=A0A0B2VXV5_TOXCA|nr:hypothetical protein Tcan_12627 [Toxocara canis]
MLAKVCVFVSLVSFGTCQLSCAFCQVGLSNIVSTIQDTPGALERIGWQLSSKCDSVPNKASRIECRKMLREHFHEIFDNLLANPQTEPQQLCAVLGFC